MNEISSKSAKPNPHRPMTSEPPKTEASALSSASPVPAVPGNPATSEGTAILPDAFGPSPESPLSPASEPPLKRTTAHAYGDAPAEKKPPTKVDWKKILASLPKGMSETLGSSGTSGVSETSETSGTAEITSASGALHLPKEAESLRPKMSQGRPSPSDPLAPSKASQGRSLPKEPLQRTSKSAEGQPLQSDPLAPSKASQGSNAPQRRPSLELTKTSESQTSERPLKRISGNQGPAALSASEKKVSSSLQAAAKSAALPASSIPTTQPQTYRAYASETPRDFSSLRREALSHVEARLKNLQASPSASPEEQSRLLLVRRLLSLLASD